MIRAERFLCDLQRALIERFGLGVVAHVMIKHRQIVEGRGGVRVLRAERFLADLRARADRAVRPWRSRPWTVKHRQIVEARGGVGVFRAERFLADLQRALIERFGLGVVAHVL